MTALVPVIAGAFLASKAVSALAPRPKVPTINTPPTRVDRGGSVVADALQRRQGARVNRRTGGLGAEAPTSAGTKSKLGM